MLQPIPRLQGTDGIRGRTQLSTICPLHHPLEAFLKLDVLTETFFEWYVYQYCQELLESGWAVRGEGIVVGWDSRDLAGDFNRAAIRGIRKAGLEAWVIGILPTPAIALYGLYSGAACAFALTASHNPSDQNGIKIFLGETGLKLFPVDDERLTQRLFQGDYSLLAVQPLLGQEVDHSLPAQQLFCEFSLDVQNSWLAGDTFAQTTLILDGANGAYSPVLSPIFERLPGVRVLYTNIDIIQGINRHSGVADLEGMGRIPAEMIIGLSARFTGYSTLEMLLAEGRLQHEALRQGQAFCFALVFDGDGDRCFRVDYDPFQDDLIVSSGDKMAYWQAAFLQEYRLGQAAQPLFINTVESDLESNRAAQKLGMKTYQAAVGDKWILWQAILAETRVRFRRYSAMCEAPALAQAIQETEALLLQMENDSAFDSLKVSLALRKLRQIFLKEGGSLEALKAFESQLSQPGQTPFAIGSEESGHTITVGRLATPEGFRSVYIGNGLKSGLNTVAAISRLKPNDPVTYYHWLAEPYAHGYQKSLPIYYVDKTLLYPESSFRAQLSHQVLKTLQTHWPEVQAEEVPRPEEPPMLSWLLSEGGNPLATLFVRNSGTEDKMSLYLRGRQNDQKLLTTIGEELYHWLLHQVKDLNKPFAQAERSILVQLSAQALTTEAILLADASLPKARLLKEMSAKQNLIRLQEDRWHLTPQGKNLLLPSVRN